MKAELIRTKGDLQRTGVLRALWQRTVFPTDRTNNNGGFQQSPKPGFAPFS